MKPTKGMKTVIINWKAGENDPFTVMNAAIAQHFRACGKNVAVVELTDEGWAAQIVDLSFDGIDFVFTWQGLGSTAAIENPQGKTSLWDLLKIPIICVHGDHPSHSPQNHLLESRYCFHLYSTPEFASYSNRHFRRLRSAGVIDIPTLHSERPLPWPTDDCFVVIKNITDPIEVESGWRQTLDKWLFEAHMTAAEALKQRIARDVYIDIHEVIDELIEAGNGMEKLRVDVAPSAFHQFHSNLDHYARNHKSVAALNAVREFPVRIYGRGWDRIAQDAPSHHTFHAGLDMASSQPLYFTRFGLIDISASRFLHDRAHRSMVNGCSFLSNAYFEGKLPDVERYSSLFYTFRPQDLQEKCAAVMAHPEDHRDLSRQFAQAYFERFTPHAFVDKLDALARSIDRF